MNYILFLIGFAVLALLFIFFYFKLFRKPKKLQRIWDQIQTGEVKNSIRSLKTIIYKQGGSVDAHFLLAECYRTEGNWALAVVEYRFCLKLKKKTFPHHPERSPGRPRRMPSGTKKGQRRPHGAHGTRTL